MYAPGVDRGEAMRLINEIAASDIWLTLTGNIHTREIYMHTDVIENAEALLVSYICSNEKLRERVITILKLKNLL